MLPGLAVPPYSAHRIPEFRVSQTDASLFFHPIEPFPRQFLGNFEQPLGSLDRLVIDGGPALEVNQGTISSENRLTHVIVSSVRTHRNSIPQSAFRAFQI